MATTRTGGRSSTSSISSATPHGGRSVPTVCHVMQLRGRRLPEINEIIVATRPTPHAAASRGGQITAGRDTDELHHWYEYETRSPPAAQPDYGSTRLGRLRQCSRTIGIRDYYGSTRLGRLRQRSRTLVVRDARCWVDHAFVSSTIRDHDHI
jgi:hypothetical protein